MDSPAPADASSMQFVEQQRAQTYNAIQRVGLAVVVFYVFGVFSAVIDKIPFLLPFRLTLLAALIGLSIVAITGRLTGLLKHTVGMSLLAFTIWMLLCIPMSIWQGGAFATFTNEWQKAALTFFLVGGLIVDYVYCRKVVHTLAYSAIILAVMSLYLGGNVVGRLVLSRTRYANPNDLAMILLTALPALGFMAMRPSNGLRRVIAVVGSVPVLIAIAKTGSRGAVIGAAVMALVVFIKANAMDKLKLIVGTFVALTLCAAVLPSDLQQRFFTLFGDEESLQSGNADMNTIGSTHSRKELLLDSIYVTVANPVFGVGPGMFPVAQDKLAKERGREQGQWHVTHNTYTQVSSECGIPGLIFFMGAVVGSFRSLTRLQKTKEIGPAFDEIRMLANTLRVSTYCFCTIAMFASVAYLPFLTILSGLIVGLEYSASQARLRVATPYPARMPRAPYRTPEFTKA
jgi:hypothetical protein